MALIYIWDIPDISVNLETNYPMILIFLSPSKDMLGGTTSNSRIK
jgi:hypothetical protein